MKQICFPELAQIVRNLPVNGKIYLSQSDTSKLFCITNLHIFKNDITLIFRFKDKFPSLFDASCINNETILYWLKNNLEGNANEKFYLVDETELPDVTPDDKTTGSVHRVIPRFSNRIKTLREDIINEIILILKENNLSQVDLKNIIKEPTYVLWSDDDGIWYDSPVVSVSLIGEAISIDVEDTKENVFTTLYSKDLEVAFNNPGWLESIRQNILETIKITQKIKNNTQLSLLKKWNIYLIGHDDQEPSYAYVSIRFKNDTKEEDVIISLTDFHKETDEQIFYYVNSLEELIKLADTDEKINAEDFIVTSLNFYSH